METIVQLASDPAAWAGLLALVTMEVVLGIDNLIFIAIITSNLPPERQQNARRIGIGLALAMRLALLSTITWIVGLTQPVFDLGFAGDIGSDGELSFETAFSWRDLILIVGGAFLLWKATTEIHHKVDPRPTGSVLSASRAGAGFLATIIQIILIDIVFSVDSILTAVGMTDELPIMVAAVVIAVAIMLIAAEPVSRFVNDNPTVVMLALAFLLMIGMILVADGLGRHVPKGYIYAAMAFAVFVEFLNMLARRRGRAAKDKAR